jgi:hypothetical protein
LIKDKECLKKWCDIVSSGKDVVIYDFDGPRDSDTTPLCKEIE